jgi:membrane-bound metal-dependent hydrolase YbcI (DUF457 family)
MADFKTHITVSSIAGALYGLGGYQSGMPLESCVIGGALCSVSGMLPDLDSDSGIPLREAVAFACAIVPILLVERFRRMGMSHELMVVTTIAVYFLLRFVIAELFRRYTVHRGMWHSMPAAITAFLFAFLIASCENIGLRMFKATAIFIGFMSHILLDEIWSVEFRRGRYMFKHSFGTALKFWGNSLPANLFSYALVAVLLGLAYFDEGLMHHFGYHAEKPTSAIEWLNSFRQHTENIFRR